MINKAVFALFVACATALVLLATGHARGAMPPVVMVHGAWPGSPSDFDAMAAAFRAKGYTVYTPQMPTPYDPQANAYALKAFIDGLGVPQVHLVGHSMGGIEARYYLKFLGGTAKVIDLTTIDSPAYGFWWGCFLPGGFMCPGSAFYSHLNEGDDTPGPSRYVELMGQIDLWPLDGGVCTAHIDGDHGSLPSQPAVIADVLAAVGGACPGTYR